MQTADFERMVADRRALHRIPEHGFDLFKTRAFVMAALKETEPDVLEMCADGIKAVFYAKDPQDKAIAFRADMDALKINEATEHDFRSEHEGMMHACGHDGHTSALIALARVLNKRRGELKRHVVLLFQPAEENYGGAEPMLAAGAFDTPEVSEVYGMHLMPSMPIGTIGSCVGPMMSAIDTFRIDVVGKAAHGASPQLGYDALMAASCFVLNAQAALNRRIDPKAVAVMTIGKLVSGTAHNIVSERAEISGCIRTFDETVHEQATETILATLRSADSMYGTESKYTVEQRYLTVLNDADAVARVRACTGEAHYETVEPVTISEDFSYFQRKAKGAFFFCGCGDEERNHPLHSDKFDFDEAALKYAVGVFEKLAFGEDR